MDLLLLRSPAIPLGSPFFFFFSDIAGVHHSFSSPSSAFPSCISWVHHYSSSAFPSYIFGVHHSSSSSAFPSYISGAHHSSSPFSSSSSSSTTTTTTTTSSSSTFPSDISGVHLFLLLRSSAISLGFTILLLLLLSSPAIYLGFTILLRRSPAKYLGFTVLLRSSAKSVDSPFFFGVPQLYLWGSPFFF